MFHTKPFQRCMAYVYFVIGLIAMLGVLTFLLCVHLHRSSSLEKKLGFEEILKSPKHGSDLPNIENQKSVYQNTGPDIGAQFTTASVKTVESMQTHNYIDEGAFLVQKRIEASKNQRKKSTYTLKPDPSLETFAYTDTIYIDDFERGKTLSSPQSENKSRETDKKFIRIKENFAEKLNESKSEFRKRKTTKKTNLKMRQNDYLKNNKDDKGNVLDYYEIDRSVSNTERNFLEKNQMHFNLDTSFDVPLRNYKYSMSSNDEFEDDTEEELILNGSGSGDFAFADNMELEQFPYYTNHFTTKYFNPVKNNGDSRLVKSSFIEKRNSGEGFKRKVNGNSKRNKNKNKNNLIIKNFKTPSNNETVPNISAPQKLLMKTENFSKEKLFRKKQSQQKRSKKISTGAQGGANEKATKLDELRQKNLEVRNSSPETWLETRTRRIIGNVRKSEERSRQLLLCEEAGGGELCRMLFKGHISE